MPSSDLMQTIYMDHHATTRVDPRVVEAMLPCFETTFGNPASTTHSFGWHAKRSVDEARGRIAQAIGARDHEILWTSGATESNNLAIRGLAQRLAHRGNHLVSVATEHASVLAPLKWLERRGFVATLVAPIRSPHPQAGRVLPEQIAEAIRPETILVSVALANHEIGAIAPLEAIGRICKERGIVLHTDAIQALGKIPIDVDRLGVDLMSFSAYKNYGPKGVGALYVRRRSPAVRLEPQILGGGYQGGLRSGTLNTPGIVGLARAVELCLAELDDQAVRLGQLRDGLFARLTAALTDISLNGPALTPPEWRLTCNLNVRVVGMEAESLLVNVPGVAASSGSACSSAQPEPSHVLRALGLDNGAARESIRFGLGRWNTTEEVDRVVELFRDAVVRLRTMNSRSVIGDAEET